SEDGPQPRRRPDGGRYCGDRAGLGGNFCRDGNFVVRDRLYNKRQPFTFIEDEDIAERCREYIDQRLYCRKKGERRFRIADFQRWVNTVCLRKELAGGAGISRSTARSWIVALGFRWARHAKRVYADGHNRPDVLEARKEFTAQMFILRRTMFIPHQVETTVMVKAPDAEDREWASTE
ncbi:unnamed protein product, partial [Pylaiella littoralis]